MSISRRGWLYGYMSATQLLCYQDKVESLCESDLQATSRCRYVVLCVCVCVCPWLVAAMCVGVSHDCHMRVLQLRRVVLLPSPWCVCACVCVCVCLCVVCVCVCGCVCVCVCAALAMVCVCVCMWCVCLCV